MSKSAFDFNSVFKYSRLPSNDHLFRDNSEPDLDREKVNPFINSLVHRIIVFTFYVLLIITFPISAFFCIIVSFTLFFIIIIITITKNVLFRIKRIKSLQRCVVYRLGLRLPLKGPGIQSLLLINIYFNILIEY